MSAPVTIATAVGAAISKVLEVSASGPNTAGLEFSTCAESAATVTGHLRARITGWDCQRRGILTRITAHLLKVSDCTHIRAYIGVIKVLDIHRRIVWVDPLKS